MVEATTTVIEIIDPQPEEFLRGWMQWTLPAPLDGLHCISWHVATHRRLNTYFTPIDQYAPWPNATAMQLAWLSDVDARRVGFDGLTELRAWWERGQGGEWDSTWVWITRGE